MSEREGTVLQMPNSISCNTVDQVLRLLGFTPHQVVKVTIDNSEGGMLGCPVLTVEVKAHNQRLTRIYECRGSSPYPVHVLPEEENQ